MQFGTFMFVGDQTMSIVDLASATEERGFESLWVPEHTHIPTSRRSPYRLGGELPPEYYHLLDPFVRSAQPPASRLESSSARPSAWSSSAIRSRSPRRWPA